MTQVNGMNCAEFAEVAAELELGVLTGRERAGALAHLDDCDACAADIRPLTVGEQLIGLLPPSEPPLGLESRVMERLGFAAPRHRSPRRRPPEPGHRARRMLAAAAVAVAAAGLGGWGLHVATSAPPPRPAWNSAALLAAGHQNEGEIFLYTGEPRWTYMYVHLQTGSEFVTCQLESADGRVTTIGSFWLTDGHGSWGSPGWVGHDPPAGARLLASDGTVLATASFPKTAS
jgi:hypothetical protein